jgi:nucleoside-diphosphate-sugar epimerase
MSNIFRKVKVRSNDLTKLRQITLAVARRLLKFAPELLTNQKNTNMRVFVTGATGFIGSEIVKELIGAGHHVLGLARSDEGAKKLAAAGAEVHRGSLEDLDSLKSGASASDGVIHTGFIHDFSRFQACCEIDRGVIGTLGAALAGTDRPLIITSGIGLLAQGRLAMEGDLPYSGPGAVPRVATEEAAAAAAASGVRVSIVRLPPTVHGEGDHGFVPMVIAAAREKGASAYVDEGQNRWPAVHRIDAAKLYRLVLEKGASAAPCYHAVAEEGVAFKDIATAIGHHLHIPVVSRTKEETSAHFGWFAHFAAMDIPASSAQTREHLGWQPTEPGLIADLNRPGSSYFKLA